MNPKFIRHYMDVAELTSKLSYANRLKVGAVFVSTEGVMSTGVNGMPSGGSNECENKVYMESGAGGWIDPEDILAQWPYMDAEKKRYKLVTKSECSHAEENLFAKMMRQGVSTIGGTIFVTTSPCIHCAKIIVGSGVVAVYYRSKYRDDAGINWLLRNGVTVVQVTP